VAAAAHPAITTIKSMITITGIRDHDETETAITFDRNLRSRSTGTRTITKDHQQNRQGSPAVPDIKDE